MRSNSAFLGACCVAAALAAVACGTEDDSSTGNSAGASGHSAGSGSSGAAGHNPGGGSPGVGGGSGGTAAGGAMGEAGEGDMAGAANTCTQLSDLVHGLIKNATTDKSLPTPVNGVVFCDDPADPAAYKDLF